MNEVNSANITYYLRKQIDALSRDIKIKYQDIESYHRRIHDAEKSIGPLRVHYTSLLNTLLAYGMTEKDLKEAGYDTLDDQV